MVRMLYIHSQNSMMLSEFRARYPTGSLISDLLKIHEGQYVVRVLVEVDGHPVATGMATDDSLEQAEDRARLRALSALGLDVSLSGVSREIPSRRSLSVETPGSFGGSEPLSGGQRLGAPASVGDPGRTPVSPVSHPSWERSPHPARPASPPPSRWESASTSEEPWEETVASDSASQTVPLPSRGDREAPSMPSRDFDEFESSSSTPAPERPTPAKPTPIASAAPETDPDEEPADLSNLIAKTTIEIRRLGWTTDQGRKHLEMHYNGKRSRSELSPEELLDFYEYLKTQPDP